MEYVLVHKNNVAFGPINWNTRIFNTVLQDELNIDYSVSVSQESDVPLTIDDDTKIMPCRHVYPASGGGITKDLYGPDWNLSGAEAVGTYTYQDKDAGALKRELKSLISSKRWEKQNAGTTVTVNGVEVRVGTSKEDKDIFVAALSDGIASRNWKFQDTWVTVDNAGLQTIIDAIAQHVQTQFDWEAGKSAEIDACTSLAQLDAFHNAYVESLKPVMPA